MNRVLHTWTFPEVKKLGEMAASGMRGPEMAAALGRTRNSVIGKCRDMGFKVKHGGALPHKSALDQINEASSDLKEAILDLFVRTCNARNLSIEEAQSYHLGQEPAKRASDLHTYFGTASIERLAA